MAVPVYYAVLGLRPGAGEAEIDAAFRILAAHYHPESNPDDRYAARRYRAVAEAYAVLGDPIRRARYDAQLATRSGSVRDRRARPTEHADRAASWTGDGQPEAVSTPVLSPARERRTPSARKRLRRGMQYALGAATLAGLVWTGLTYRSPMETRTAPGAPTPHVAGFAIHPGGANLQVASYLRHAAALPVQVAVLREPAAAKPSPPRVPGAQRAPSPPPGTARAILFGESLANPPRAVTTPHHGAREPARRAGAIPAASPRAVDAESAVSPPRAASSPSPRALPADLLRRLDQEQ